MVRRLNVLLDEETDTSTHTDTSTEDESAPPVKLTPRAAKKYLDILALEGKQGWGMRFGEQLAGCNGFEYVLDYSEKALPSDETCTSCGIDIHIDKGIVKKLRGSIIDYVDGLQGSGFKISNPNVKSACGCGSSHGY